MMANANLSLEAALSIAPRTYPSQKICKRIYQTSLLIGDAVALVLAFALAYWLRFHLHVGISIEVEPPPRNYIFFGAVLIPVWLGLFALLRCYDFNHLLGGTSEYTRAANSCTSGMMLVVVTSFLDPTFIIARGWLVMAWVLSIVLVCSTRLMLRRLAYALRSQGYFVTPALIVGTNPEAISLAEQMKDSVYSGVAILGFVDEYEMTAGDRAVSTLAGLPVVGSLDNLPELIRRYGVEEVILTASALTREQRLSTALWLAAMPGTKMSLSSGLYEIFTTSMSVNTRNQVPLLSMNRLRLDPVEIALKTALDYLVVLLALPVVLLIFVAIGSLIKLDSPGPIFYRRRVLGIGGKAFDAFKFRTMVTNGDEVLAQYPEKLHELRTTHKLKDDPRVTRIGHFLRRTSLDELPQVLNVLLGQMSLVGPRMIHPDEAAMYGLYKSNLLTVKPGLTGLWQVSGRSDVSYSDRVQLDMYYIRNYSIWLDIQILFFQTIPTVFAKRGAY
ncbi:MAG TPA: sugar transferase [Caldilineaceae bacterium]|nr:sugar transferase [Caldilineaceae bacterium]